MKNKALKFYTLDEMMDKHLGQVGTPKRDAFEHELEMDLLSETIKKVRLEKNMTQEELGKLIGVQKAQIVKLEKGAINARLDTIFKVMTALNAKINFNIEIMSQQMTISNKIA